MSDVSCHGSTDEQIVWLWPPPAACFTKSLNVPSAATFPTYTSRIAYPTQLRRSAEPCVSQVFEDSVIQMRMWRVETGKAVRLSSTSPPFPCSTAPAGNVCQIPFVAFLRGLS